MSAEATAATMPASESDNKNLWGGGVSPFKVSYGKIMMWYFLISDTFSFIGFLIAYGASRFSSGEANWPDANVVFEATPFGFYLPLFFVTFMTFVLIFSSVTMVRAVQEGHRGNKKGVVIWMLWTIAGGLLFLGCQAWEWTHLIQDGTTLAGNPFGDKKFGQFFFLITGFHGLHVTVGVIINCIVCFQAAIGTYERRGHYEMIEKVGLYWHFVDLVWVYVFLAFYLL